LRIKAVGSETRYPVFPSCEVPQGFIAENRKYELELETDSFGDTDLEIAVEDAFLDRMVRAKRTFFPLDIDFYAGNLQITIMRDRRVLACIDLTVDPDIAKITRDDYASMLAELARSTLALYRLGAVSIRAETSASAIRSDLVTLDLIRSNLGSFERAVRLIADQPVRRLQATSALVELTRARRIEDRALARALISGESRPATSTERAALPRLVGALGGRWVPRVMESRKSERLDIYEHRALLGFINWLDSTVSLIAQRISGDRDTDHVRALIWIERIARWRHRLAALRRRELFANLRPEHGLQPTITFRMDPMYASAFSAMSRMRAGLGTGSASTPSVPIDRTYALYEMWCYVGLLHAVANRFPDVLPGVRALLRGCPSPSAIGAILSRDETAKLTLNDSVSLTYQRRFAPTPNPDGTRTTVVEAIPDITIARVDHAGICTGLVVIDPKYRAGSSLADGIRDLHVYRDSIVNTNRDRLVRAAAVLAPRGNEASLSALPLDAPSIYVTRPGQSATCFDNLLDLALGALR